MPRVVNRSPLPHAATPAPRATHHIPGAEGEDWMTALSLHPTPSPAPRLAPDRMETARSAQAPSQHVSSTLILGPRSRRTSDRIANADASAAANRSEAVPTTIQASMDAAPSTPSSASAADEYATRRPPSFRSGCAGGANHIHGSGCSGKSGHVHGPACSGKGGHIHGPGCSTGLGHVRRAASLRSNGESDRAAASDASSDAEVSDASTTRTPENPENHDASSQKNASEKIDPPTATHVDGSGCARGAHHTQGPTCSGHVHGPSCGGHAHGASDDVKVKPFLERLTDHSLVRMLQATTGILMIPLTPLMIYALVKSVEPLKECLPSANP